MRRCLPYLTLLVLGACDRTATAPVPCPPAARIEANLSGTIVLGVGHVLNASAEVSCLPGFRGIAWSTSDPAVASLEPTSNGAAVIRALASGVATITAAATANPRLTTSIVVRVTSQVWPKGPPPPAGSRSAPARATSGCAGLPDASPACGAPGARHLTSHR